MDQTKPPEAQKIFQSQDAARSVVLHARQQKTQDGFKNFALKLGVVTQGDEGCADNTISAGGYQFNLVTRNPLLLEAAYRGSWIVGRIINSVAEDMTRAGIVVNTSKGASKLTDFKVQMSRLQIWQSLFDVEAWGRLYGGAIGVLQIDGQDLSSPLNLESVSKDQFKGIAVYDRWQLNPSMSQIINIGPEIGLPKFYDIVLGNNANDPGLAPGAGDKSGGHATVRVHHSRCIRVVGIKLPYRQAITENMWGESILERLWDRLIEFDTTNSSAAGLVTRANLRTVGIAGLREILAAGGEAQEALVSMFDYMRKFQSSEGLTLLDKEDEFQSTAYSFAGLSDMIIQFGQQLSGSSEIPLVRLFGQSPAGLNATGESDLRNYYDSINAKQESTLRNPVEVILRVMWRSCFNEAAPDDLSFTFTPLWQMSAIDKATIATQNTQAIVAAHDDGLVSASTAMKELKQSSSETGLFAHITDEEIAEAGEELPPAPGMGAEPDEQQNELGKLAPDKEKKTAKAGDSAWKKIKKWLSRDDGNFKESDHPRAKNGEFGKGGKSKSKGTTTKTPPDVEMIPEDIFEPNLTPEQEANARGRFRKPDDRPNPSTETPEQNSERRHSLEKKMREKNDPGRASKNISETGKKKDAALEKLQKLQREQKHLTPEYAEAAKEYKSSNKAHNKSLREGKKILSDHQKKIQEFIK